jgi:PIN domain nuclease of toxin-antitoxin system
MNIIIDTHIFLQSLVSPEKIDKQRIYELETQANTIYVSSVSIAEIMIKASLGKLTVPFDPAEMIVKSGFEELSFTVKAAILLKDLPFHHRDPFDRMLIAQSIAHNYHIMSNDGKFAAYDCKLL